MKNLMKETILIGSRFLFCVYTRIFNACICVGKNVAHAFDTLKKSKQKSKYKKKKESFIKSKDPNICLGSGSMPDPGIIIIQFIISRICPIFGLGGERTWTNFIISCCGVAVASGFSSLPPPTNKIIRGGSMSKRDLDALREMSPYLEQREYDRLAKFKELNNVITDAKIELYDFFSLSRRLESGHYLAHFKRVYAERNKFMKEYHGEDFIDETDLMISVMKLCLCEIKAESRDIYGKFKTDMREFSLMFIQENAIADLSKLLKEEYDSMLKDFIYIDLSEHPPLFTIYPPQDGARVAGPFGEVEILPEKEYEREMIQAYKETIKEKIGEGSMESIDTVFKGQVTYPPEDYVFDISAGVMCRKVGRHGEIGMLRGVKITYASIKRSLQSGDSFICGLEGCLEDLLNRVFGFGQILKAILIGIWEILIGFFGG